MTLTLSQLVFFSHERTANDGDTIAANSTDATSLATKQEVDARYASDEQYRKQYSEMVKQRIEAAKRGFR